MLENIRGIIFDMDGVLCDSEPFICEAAILMYKELGYTVFEEDFIPFVGAGENRYVGGVAEKYNIPLDIETAKARTYSIYCDIIKGKLKPLKGVHEFIAKAREKGLKLAVASIADYVKVKANLTEIDLPFESFDIVINGLLVEHKKPNPDIFLMAAEKLGLSRSECLVCEDAVNGIEAARAAGSKCLGVMSSFSAEELKADFHVNNLGEALFLL